MPKKDMTALPKNDLRLSNGNFFENYYEPFNETLNSDLTKKFN